jgi:hypothetical protein
VKGAISWTTRPDFHLHHLAELGLIQQVVIDELGGDLGQLGAVGTVRAALELQPGRDPSDSREVRQLLERGLADRPMVRVALQLSQRGDECDPTRLKPAWCRGVVGSSRALEQRCLEVARLKLLVGRPEWRVELDWDLQPAQVCVQRRADDAPLEPTVAATKRWDGDGRDAPFLVVPLEVLQAGHDVSQLRDPAPVLLRREVQDVGRKESLKHVRLADADQACFAAASVVLEHVWEPLLELKRHPVAHHPDGVDGVDERLSRRQLRAA